MSGEKSTLNSSGSKQNYGTYDYQRLEDEQSSQRRPEGTRYGLVVAVVSFLCIAGMAAGLGSGLPPLLQKLEVVYSVYPPDPRVLPGPSKSEEGHYKHAAVSSDSQICANIGRDILQKNGSAVDATIAATICLGVVLPHNTGLGGGFLMTMYIRANKSAVVLNARETAPAAAYRDMYDGNANKSERGGLSVAIPSEIHGLEAAHKAYGKLPWSELVDPSVKLCDDGIPVHPSLAKALLASVDLIRRDPGLSALFINATTDRVLEVGEIFKWPTLANTLREISQKGPQELYKGNLATLLLQDIKANKGIITAEDLSNYTVRWEKPTTVDYQEKFTLFSVPPPGSGPVLAFMLNIMEGYNYSSDKLKTLTDNVTFYHLLTESFKFAYGARTRLGDQHFVNITKLLQKMESKDVATQVRGKIDVWKTFKNASYYGGMFTEIHDKGTTHVSVVAPNGDAVGLTTTINAYFGAGILSPQTGIILNNEMDDFSSPNVTSMPGLPPSPANYIQPGKRPLSSMCPAVFVDKTSGDVRLVVGGSGATTITTSVAQAVINNMWLEQGMKAAIDTPRIHHQLIPMRVVYEYGFLDQYVVGLRRRGHRVVRGEVGRTCAVSKMYPYDIYANADYRKFGGVAGF